MTKDVEKEQTCPFHDPGFVHNRKEEDKAWEAGNKARCQTLGLDRGCATPRSPQVSAEGKAQTPPKALELEEMDESEFGYQTPKHKPNSKFDTPSPRKAPPSPSCIKSCATPPSHLVSAEGKTPLNALKRPEAAKKLEFKGQTPKRKPNSKVRSPSLYKTPPPASWEEEWVYNYPVDFQLRESPELPKR